MKTTATSVRNISSNTACNTRREDKMLHHIILYTYIKHIYIYTRQIARKKSLLWSRASISYEIDEKMKLDVLRISYNNNIVASNNSRRREVVFGGKYYAESMPRKKKHCFFLLNLVNGMGHFSNLWIATLGVALVRYASG